MSKTDDAVAADERRMKRRAMDRRAQHRNAIRSIDHAIHALEHARERLCAAGLVPESVDLAACAARLRMMHAAHVANARDGATMTRCYFVELCDLAGRPSDQPRQLGGA